MADAAPLSDPSIDPAGAACMSCGYSLVGIKPPGACPECGQRFGATQCTVYGVPTLRSTIQRWQVAVVLVIVVLGPFVFQFAIATGFRYGWLVALLLPACFAALCIVMWRTTRRRGGGACRIVICGTHIAALPLKQDSNALENGAMSVSLAMGNVVDLRRVGPYWAVLRIRDEFGKQVFKAGIRCPVASEPMVRAALEQAVPGSRQASLVGE